MPDNHAELLEGYKDISAILDKHQVRYYGMYGTALGAIRHSGFIPWDDDLDIAIRGEDLDIVNDILAKELDPEKYYYHIPSADTHPHVIIKGPNFEEDLKNRRVTFIDIFLLLDSPDSAARKALAYPFCGFELLSHKIIDRTDSRMAKEVFYKLEHLSWKMIRFFSTPKTKIYGIRNVDVGGHTWRKELFGEPRPHEFEDIVMPIPNQCEKFLEETYGDYMTPPPEDQRSGATGYPYSLMSDYLEDMAGSKKHRRMSREDLPY